MELLGLLLILTAIAEKVGQALAWGLKVFFKAFALLVLAMARIAIAEQKRRIEAQRQAETTVAETTTNPNIADAVEGLKKLGLPQKSAERVVAQVAADEPTATVEDLIKSALQSLDKR